MTLQDTITNLGSTIINLVNTKISNNNNDVEEVINDLQNQIEEISEGGGVPSGGWGSSGGVKPSVCKNMSIKIDGTSVYLKWQDPGDTIIDNQVISSWGGTKIVKKVGSYPLTETDGTLVIDNKTKNAYLDTAYQDTITSGENIYYTAFPYNTDNMCTYNSKNNFVDAIIYEYTINPNDSNPSSRVAYPAGCTNENYTPFSMNFSTGKATYTDWEHAFFMPRPVMVKSDGTVDYELYKDNYAYKADGITASDYDNVEYDGNCMMAFPQVWIKYELDEGNLYHVYVSNKQVDENYHCWTHYNRLGTLVDEIFIQAFPVSNQSNKLRSLAGLNATVNLTGTTEITYAQANGDNWNLIDYGMWNMLQVILTLLGKSTDTQSTFGYGYCRGANQSVQNPTGVFADKGLFYATSGTSYNRIKVLGIEDLYGNMWKRINGCCYSTTDGMRYKMTETTIDGTSVNGYNTDGTGYLTTQTFTGTSGGYQSAFTLTEHGIFPVAASGSATTYTCDGLWWANNGFAIVGGSWGNTSVAGAFALDLDDAVSHSHSSLGGSLSCKPLS